MYLRSILTNLRRFSNLQKNEKGIVEQSKNLINPGPNDPVAFGYYFPKQWSQEKILSMLDPSKKQIMSVKIVQNKLGQSSGKILFTFKNLSVMDKYISRYNEDFIQTEDSVHKIVLKRFELKNQLKKRQKEEYNRKYGVHLTNLDFDIDKAEIERLAEDFGEIQFIDMSIRENGLNRGSAKVYFKIRQGSLDFQQFSDGLKYRERRFKSSVIKSEHELEKQKEPKEIQAPRIVMKWNEDLYKRLVRNQVDSKTNQSPQTKVF